MPAPIAQVLLTGHLPLQFASTVFITSMWVELATLSSVKIVGGLTKTLTPSIIAICVVTAFEVVTASLRANLYLIPPLILANLLIFLVLYLGLAVYILYGVVKIWRFTTSFSEVRKNDNILRAYAIRVALSEVGILGLLASEVLYIVLGSTPVPDTAIPASLCAFSTLISTAELLAMKVRTKSSSSVSTPSR